MNFPRKGFPCASKKYLIGGQAIVEIVIAKNFVHPAMHYYYIETDEDTEYGNNVLVFERESKGGVWFEVTNTALKIYNNFAGEYAEETLDNVLIESETIARLAINYAFLIFDVEGVETI